MLSLAAHELGLPPVVGKVPYLLPGVNVPAAGTCSWALGEPSIGMSQQMPWELVVFPQKTVLPLKETGHLGG